MLKGALSERDYWESAAAAHERSQFPSQVHSMVKGKGSSGRRTGGSRGQAGKSPMNASDLAIRPPSVRIPTSVPRSVSNTIVWDVVKILSTFSTSTSALSENNFSWQLALNPQAASWAALFDQWCIPQVSISFQSLLPPGSVTNGVDLVTALDFDNVTALGSLAGLSDYSSAQMAAMQPQTTVLRSVRPCIKSATSTSGSLAPTSLVRTWVDSTYYNSGTGASAAPVWYGIRSIMPASPAAYSIAVVQTIWFAFRNQI